MGIFVNKLVKYQNKIESENDYSASFIVPKKPLQLIKNTVNDVTHKINIDYNNTNIIFSFQNMQIYCRLIDGNYPNYSAVIPKENPNQLNVDRVALLNALKRVCIFSNQTTYKIKFSINGNEINLSGEDVDFSNKGQEKIKCEKKRCEKKR